MPAKYKRDPGEAADLSSASVRRDPRLRACAPQSDAELADEEEAETIPLWLLDLRVGGWLTKNGPTRRKRP